MRNPPKKITEPAGASTATVAIGSGLWAPRSALKAITALLPGAEAPTIIPLEGRDDKVAVHAVCRENVFWETLEQLKEAGASSMLVLPVEKMLS